MAMIRLAYSEAFFLFVTFFLVERTRAFVAVPPDITPRFRLPLRRPSPCCPIRHSHRTLSVLRYSTLEGADLNDNRQKNRTISSSNFWSSVVTSEQGEDNEQHVVPCVPTLDKDGPLPPGAYLKLGDVENDVKDTCRVAVAIDLPALQRSMSMEGGEQITSALQIAAKMHDYIDAGLTTFHLNCGKQQQQQHQAWGEETILGSVRKETPATVMKKCQFVIPLNLPSSSIEESAAASASSTKMSCVREAALGSLLRSGGDAIDCLEIQYVKNSPYIFDVLDTLQDMKREGLIRSISCCNTPPGILRQARHYGFAIESSRVDLNLLDPSAYSMEQRLACHDLETPLLVSGTLAGGLLTDRYVGRERMPFPWELSLAERRHWNSDMQVWKEESSSSENDTLLWEAYQTKLLNEMEAIAMKHRVSVGSVALRWSLQLEHVASAIVTCRFIHPDDGFPRKDRAQQLREVFRFELDEEDMERLWDLSGRKKQTAADPSLDLAEAESMFDEMMENESGLFVPGEIDFSDQRLWL